MKYLKFILIMCVTMLTLSSCSKEDDIAPISIDNPYVTFDANGGTQTVSFNVNGGDWFAGVKPVDKGDWFSYSPENGTEGKNTITISVLPCVGDGRSTMIELNKSGQYAELYVTQEGQINSNGDYAINLPKAGCLSGVVNNVSIYSLNLKGEINGDDVYTLNQFIKYGLSKLDISNAQIVAGGGTKVPNSGITTPLTSKNEICKEMFLYRGPHNDQYGYDNLTEIILPLSTTAIRESAFALCNKLENITIPSKVGVIEKDAFECKNLKTIHCKATTPPTLEEDAFSANVYNGTLYVPKEGYQNYKSHQVWSKFNTIIEE